METGSASVVGGAGAAAAAAATATAGAGVSSVRQYQHQHHHSIPIEVLDDLSSRFIINIPEEDRADLVRICFQIELAHWFYLDFYCPDESYNVHPCGMKEFAAHIFQHIPFLQKHKSNLANILDNWREYKLSVPTYGAIILNEDLSHVLLVQSFLTKASWGFPKGKVNEDEEPWLCACREVLEETGFDITPHLNKNDFIESTIHDQLVRLYIVGYIPKTTKFQPRTRNEIKACEWFPLIDLPSNRKDVTPKIKMGVNPNAFFMVLPFVKRLKRWVAESIKNNSSSKRLRHKSMGDLETSIRRNSSKGISQGFEKEIFEYQQSQVFESKTVINPAKNGNNQGKKDKKGNFRRKLFTNNNGQNINQAVAKQNPISSLQISFDVMAKSWMNFKFDKKAIWESMS
ncbi:decapping mRNA 2 [Arctopsyche grandis]|uniref:decapping mRNA 2 n=1 Tax=Arctopsyche grandis TaxID=121162 RepID=UPI00406D7A66